jgi:hypothetical protein
MYVIVKYGGKDGYVKSETTNTFICNDLVGKIEENSFTVFFNIKLPPMSVNVIEIIEYEGNDSCLRESPVFCSVYRRP